MTTVVVSSVGRLLYRAQSTKRPQHTAHTLAAAETLLFDIIHPCLMTPSIRLISRKRRERNKIKVRENQPKKGENKHKQEKTQEDHVRTSCTSFYLLICLLCSCLPFVCFISFLYFIECICRTCRIQCVCSFFYPSTSNTTSVRADSSIHTHTSSWHEYS